MANVIAPKELKVVAHCALLYSILKSSINAGKPIDNIYISIFMREIPNICIGIIKPYFVYFILKNTFYYLG